ncbi:MAG: hypothetical protein ACFFDT_14265 [Candidatus Hodarchaeota archaeon]
MEIQLKYRRNLTIVGFFLFLESPQVITATVHPKILCGIDLDTVKPVTGGPVVKSVVKWLQEPIISIEFSITRAALLFS